MRIRSIAAVLPSQRVGKDELVDRILARSHGAMSAAQCEQAGAYLRTQLARTGAVSRRQRAPGETALDLRLAAGRQALPQASRTPTDIDLLICCGVGRGFIEPAKRFYARPRALAQGAVRQLDVQFHGDAVFSHQVYALVFGNTVSAPLSRLMLRRRGLGAARHVEIFPPHGNVVSASLPLAMALAQQDGRLQRGQRLLLTMGGAGLTTALCSFVYRRFPTKRTETCLQFP